MSSAPEWATASGDAWAERWREVDEALGDLAPKLHSAILAAAPEGGFRALDIGCGAGSTTLALAQDRSDASIIACDLSPALVEVARERTAGHSAVQVVLGDAEQVALGEGPFDLFFSRHGVMFFDDPVRAFRSLAQAASPGAALVFSCFRAWAENPWASELATAAAGRPLPPPGREPSGFAFADPDYVRQILSAAGWTDAQAQAVEFRYVAAGGEEAVERAMAFLSEIGPASRAVRSLPESERGCASLRMRDVIERHFDGRRVAFAAAAWVWSATKAPGPQ